jgi:hypothetical protein
LNVRTCVNDVFKILWYNVLSNLYEESPSPYDVKKAKKSSKAYFIPEKHHIRDYLFSRLITTSNIETAVSEYFKINENKIDVKEIAKDKVRYTH